MNTDPLLSLITEYRDAQARFASSPQHDDAEQEASFLKVYERLCEAPPNATTFEGALAAIRLVHEEESTCGHHPDLTINALAAALAFFDAEERAVS